MPVKLIQNLRLLNPSFPITRFSIMKPNSTIKPTGVFPHWLKYQSFSKRLGFPNLSSNREPQFGNVRSFSTRRLGSDVKASKSLIEDEAELSDWVGLPTDKEQYIHRLGRTGRKGKEGQGILLLAPWEEFILSTIRDLPISKASSPSLDPDTKLKVEKALSHVEMKNKEAAYQAWLGYYNSNKTVGKDKYRLVELANDFSRCMGLDNPPAIPKLVLVKMGLRNVPGLRSK